MFVRLETFQSFPRPVSALSQEHLATFSVRDILTGVLFPLLVRALHEKEIASLQFLREGCVRVTVRSEAYREDLLSSEFRFEDTVVPVTPADCVAKSVYVRDLLFEVSDKSVAISGSLRMFVYFSESMCFFQTTSPYIYSRTHQTTVMCILFQKSAAGLKLRKTYDNRGAATSPGKMAPPRRS